jgi:hypothetical protein
MAKPLTPNAKKPIITDKRLFSLEQLTQKTRLDSFSCPIEEYNEYLFQEALRSQNDQMALTWLLLERSTGAIAAYMSLIADADIEHNETVLNFYLKNGFIPNEETSNKRRKTISMRRDILFKAKS